MRTFSDSLLARGWPAEVVTGIIDMVLNHGIDSEGYDPLAPPLAAFDWDDTCMRGDISHQALALMDERDPTGRVAAYEAACEEDLYKAYEALVHTLMTGRTRENAQKFAIDALERGERLGHVQLRPGMHRVIEEMQLAGWLVRVVTASPTPLVSALAYRYGIPPEHVLGMTSATERGRFLPSLVGAVTMGEGKLTALRAHAGRDPLFTAGDSWSDHPLMAVSRYVLLRDKGDESLRSETKSHGWWIVDEEVP